MRCPICERKFVPGENRPAPFCSARCRLVDLGRWLDEEHSVPYEPQEEDDLFFPPDGEFV